jgi:starch synthase
MFFPFFSHFSNMVVLSDADHPTFMSWGHDIYGGSREDVQFRCALLCKAALECPLVVPCGGSPYGDESLVFVANDWHTALLPLYLQAHYRDHGKYTYARSIFVLHNIAHQGRGPMAELEKFEVPPQYTETFRLYDPVGGEHMNIMKVCLNSLLAPKQEKKANSGGFGLNP